MPKTTKRTETKRAERVARAHSTELPLPEIKRPTQDRRSSGYKAPARGIARYPWLTGILVALLLGGGYSFLFFNHIGPFALPPKKAAASCLADSVIKQITNTAAGPTDQQLAAIKHAYNAAPAMSIDTQKIYCAGINTNRGLIVVELDPKIAPNTVNNFVYLAQNHYYDGMVFHRVIQSGTGLHIIQTGDPLGKDLAKRGTGGPGYKFNDEPVQGNYTVGTLAMANSGANTNGSQFFINTSDNTSLPKSYNLFGHVVKGLDVAQKIQGPGDDAATKNVTPDVINYMVTVAAS